MSLKKRIVSWYTIWTLVLMALIFILFFSVSSSLSLRSLRHDVENVISDAADDVTRGDHIDFDDLDEFDDGVYTSIYKTDGSLLFGRNLDRIDNISYREGQRVINFTDTSYVISDMMLDGYFIRCYAEHSNIYTLLSSDYLSLLIAAPVLVLISALGGAFIVKKAFKPLEDLIKTASGIASGDDLSLRLESGNTKEGVALSSSFNSMLSRLEESFLKQKEFTDDASHELRTPLSVIKAESEYALTVLDDRSDVESSLNVIKNESERMARLLDSLLMLSRSDNGRMKLNKRTFSLSKLLLNITESLSDIANEKGLTLDSDIDDGLFVFADEDLVTRAVINLINNAMSYSKENGNVFVRLKRKAGAIVLDVIDDGIGIKEEDLKRVFDRFFQVDKSRNGSSQGLGLAMVKEIAKQNNIEIDVESAFSKGSKFSLIFKEEKV